MQASQLTPWLKIFMTVATGVLVANMYYCQPLLGRFSDTFLVDEASAAWINISSQLGYGIGLFFLVPLGDMVAKRNLIIVLILCATLAVTGAALATNIYMLYFFSFAIGVTSTGCQVFVPLAGQLAADKERGKVIGTIMGGLLTGILVSRTLSGFVADHFGWRTIYWVAACFMLVFAALTARFVPTETRSFSGNYRSLISSMFGFLHANKVVRQSAWIGGCLFGALSVFWSTMAFFLEKEPFSYSLSVIGLFGLIGAAGALISPWVGKINDEKGPVKPMQWGIAAMIAGYLFLFESTSGIVYLILGIVLIDMGLQSTHVPTLTRMAEIEPSARTRLNTLYMTAFFLGGTLGSIIGSYAWDLAGWAGVCTAGLVWVMMGGLPIFLDKKGLRFGAGGTTSEP